ncbi:hypothetical protein G210_4795 [Candida maltosa Xu316]|uniref:GYF domain-containing protein n=1 Tax=Candida maltosa (strain Xu316) TaxID=1245528 RepID=M3K5X1_CANMX|nr:hypothetical protein G210_4795 [Candida maltosa Xu316]
MSKKVKLQYESDSDEGKGSENEDYSDDMFSDEDDQVEPEKIEEISENDNDDDDDDDDGQDYYNHIEDIDERGIRKKPAPKIEAFNLDEEEEEGRFDSEGNYIPNNKDDQTDNDDTWLDDYKKADIKKARKAQEEREKLNAQRRIDQNVDMDPIEKLIADLVDLLEPDETPTEALVRLNLEQKKNKSSLNGSIINKVIDLCSTLTNDKDLDDVYELTREQLMRIFEKETGKPFLATRGTKRSLDEDNEEEETYYGEKIWEYRWIGEDEIYGPYSNYEMNHWKETYFENNVEVRKVGDTDFTSVTSIDFLSE